jgi:hypothetical protein
MSQVFNNDAITACKVDYKLKIYVVAGGIASLYHGDLLLFFNKTIVS